MHSPFCPLCIDLGIYNSNYTKRSANLKLNSPIFAVCLLKAESFSTSTEAGERVGGRMHPKALSLLLITLTNGYHFPGQRKRGLGPDSQTQELNFYTCMGPGPQPRPPPYLMTLHTCPRPCPVPPVPYHLAKKNKNKKTHIDLGAPNSSWATRNKPVLSL